MRSIKTIIIRVLISLGKRAKTDVLYLAKGGFWLTLSQIITIGFGFGLSVAFAHFLTPEVYGGYRYLLSWFSILAIPILPGIDGALIRSVAAGKDGAVLIGLKEKFKWSTFSSLASLVGVGYCVFTSQPLFAISFAIAAILIPFMESFSVYDAVLQGKSQFKYSAYASTVSNIFTASCLLIVLLLFPNNLPALILTYLGAWAFIRFILYVIIDKKLITNRTGTHHDTLIYARHLSVMELFPTIANNLDKIIIFNILGPVQLAIYSFALAPVDQIKGFQKSISTLVFPRFVNRPWSDIQSSLGIKIFRFIIGTGLLISIYCLFATWFFQTFFPQYISAVPYSQILALSLLFMSAYIPTAALQAHGLVKELYSYHLISSIAQIIVPIALVFPFGLWGAVWGRLAVRALSLIISYYLVMKTTKNKT